MTFVVALVIGAVLLRHWRAAGAVLLVIAFALLLIGMLTVLHGMDSVRQGTTTSLAGT